MKDLRGKRLLILGGSMWKEAIKEFATKYGVTLIAIGNDTSAGIFEIADEGYAINSTDAESVKKLIKEKKIDGVYMGGSEPVIAAACKYINELGLPCYCTNEQWEYLQDKSKFKKLCQEYGLPVAPQYVVNIENIENAVPIDAYPVITKPTDGCGSSGFSKCNNLDELKRGFEVASEASPTGSVIVEKFVKNDGVVVFYTFSNGVMHFSGLEDKYPVIHIKQGSYVGGLFVFESNLTQDFRSKFDDKLQTLFSSIGIKEGSVWIEVFYDNGQYYFNEVGYRYGGSVSVYPVDYYYSINQVAADMYYALTGESSIKNHQTLIPTSVPRKKHYCVYPLHIKPGVINQICGIGEVSGWNEIVFLSTTKQINDVVADTGSFSQAYALIHFVCDTVEECRDIIDRIHSTVVVRDDKNENMIKRMLDINKILF